MNGQHLHYRPYAIDVITQITKRETDGGRKFGYYAVQSSKYSRAPFSPVQEMILDMHPECARFQQDLTLTEPNKLTCTPRWHCELTKCFAVLNAIYHGLPCHSKWWRSIRISVHCPFHVWLREVLHKVYYLLITAKIQLPELNCKGMFHANCNSCWCVLVCLVLTTQTCLHESINKAEYTRSQTFNPSACHLLHDGTMLVLQVRNKVVICV